MGLVGSGIWVHESVVPEESNVGGEEESLAFGAWLSLKE